MTMSGDEVGAASQALFDWLESQEIHPSDAVRVLTTTLVACIHQISLDNGLPAKDGGRIIADIIVSALP